MAETEIFRLNIGVLRSHMILQIHTRQASRLWYGRRKTAETEGIMGLNAFLSITNRINIGSKNDDPYSDWWMLQVEEKIDQVNTRLKTLKEEVDRIFENVPSTFSISENLNVQPANLPIFAGSHLGYLAIFALAQFDEIIRKALLAHHIALIDHGELDYWLERGDHQLRSLFHVVQHYRFTGVSRKDLAEGNAVAQAALEKFGEVPADVLDGSRRSRFSPPLRTGAEAVSDDSEELEAQGNELTVIVPTESAFDPQEAAGNSLEEGLSDA